jgi:hypothetical protein
MLWRNEHVQRERITKYHSIVFPQICSPAIANPACGTSTAESGVAGGWGVEWSGGVGVVVVVGGVVVGGVVVVGPNQDCVYDITTKNTHMHLPHCALQPH